MEQLHTFFAADGSELRVRATVELPPIGQTPDYARVFPTTQSGFRRLARAGKLTWGMGRFAPVTLYHTKVA